MRIKCVGEGAGAPVAEREVRRLQRVRILLTAPYKRIGACVVYWHVYNGSMSRTEVQTFRTTPEDKAAVAHFAKMLGHNSPGEFLGQMVAVMISADHKRIGAFLQNMTRVVGEQMFLELEAQAQAQKQAEKPRIAAKARKGAAARAKRV